MENSVDRNHVNRSSKILELTIQLYMYYGEHEAPSSFNATVYLSLTQLSIFLLVTAMIFAKTLHCVPFLVDRQVFGSCLDKMNDSLLSLYPFTLRSLDTFRRQYRALLIFCLEHPKKLPPSILCVVGQGQPFIFLDLGSGCSTQ